MQLNERAECQIARSTHLSRCCDTRPFSELAPQRSQRPSQVGIECILDPSDKDQQAASESAHVL
jgi:hypothetical protein